MATARLRVATEPHLLIGQTVHYRDRHRCWAAAVVGTDERSHVQLFLFPLPPAVPMPQAPGGFVRHDGSRGGGSWHRLGECEGVMAPAEPREKPRRRSRRKQT